MQTVIETHTHKDHTIEIHVDLDCGRDSPRDWDNLGTLAIMGGAGDEEPTTPPSNSIWLPVYRYEHSGVAYNTTGFHCPWDSGQTGYIYVSKADVRKEWGVKRISPKLRAQVEKCLRSEVETFGQWANGEVYGYVIKDADDNEIDSCWGFYGFDYVQSEAEAAIS